MSNVKQVIVIRKDLKMRRGKEIAQGAHAAMGYMKVLFGMFEQVHRSDAPVFQWLLGDQTKIVVQVSSEQELLDLKALAETQGVYSYLVTDQGRTEFGGVPTVTAMALGPAFDWQLDPITKHLPLY